MTDLVKRLRTMNLDGSAEVDTAAENLMRDAADELEKMRVQIEDMVHRTKLFIAGPLTSKTDAARDGAQPPPNPFPPIT